MSETYNVALDEWTQIVVPPKIFNINTPFVRIYSNVFFLAYG